MKAWNIKEISREFLKYPSQKTDLVCGVAGEEGTGKSVLSRLISREISPKFLHKPLCLDEVMYFGKKSMAKAMETTYNGLFIHDEAIANISRTFWDKDQIEFVKLMRMVRDHNHIAFFNLPVLWELDKILRNRIRVYIYILQRVNLVNKMPGLAVIFKKEINPFTSDPWNVKMNEKLFRMGKIQRSRNFYGYLTIPYIEEAWFMEMEEEALRLKDKKKKEAIDEDKKDEQEYKTSVIADIVARMEQDRKGIFKHGHLLRISHVFDINASTLRDAVSESRRRWEVTNIRDISGRTKQNSTGNQGVEQ